MGVCETFRSFFAFLKENKYAVYVVFMFMLAYMVQQCNKFSLIATNTSMANDIKYGDKECSVQNETAAERAMVNMQQNMSTADFCKNLGDSCPSIKDDGNYTSCYWRYTGLGTAYDMLAGPFYVVLYSVSALPMGLVSELSRINRRMILSICVILWSLMTVCGAFVTQYWHIAITRLLLGVFSAGCVPMCASMLGDYFAPEKRGASLGFFNWGVFLGYSLTFVLIVAERDLGWRPVYLISGIPGVVIGVIILITVKEPIRKGAASDKALDQLSGMLSKLKTAALHFIDPALLLHCLGGGIRMGAGIVWSYNIKSFFAMYHPGTQLENWMSWIPLIFGSAGVFGGGYISDKLSANRGTRGRMMVLIGCTVIAAPLQVGTLYAPMPWTFVFHIFAYVFGEMWLGVASAVVIDLVPSDLTASAVAVYFFIIQIIGGNMNLLVTPIRESLDMRTALLITFPGLYLIGALFFLFAFLILLRRKVNQYEVSQVEAKQSIEIKDVSQSTEKANNADAQGDISKVADPENEYVDPYTYIPSTEQLYENANNSKT